MNLKKDYTLAKCCTPIPKVKITGYFSQNNIIKVHENSCKHLNEVNPERLISLEWKDILFEKEKFAPDNVYFELDQIDFAILQHHLDYGIDYSLVVARKIQISKQEAFEHHKKLKELKLLERVEARIVQYRKGIVDNKWIKHRNHTYYKLTESGEKYIYYHLSNKQPK